ncbi:MAG: hypothetical protein QOK40_1542 [Miltoncostaeaceae bacterium]|nr:hypothetical protein [Miltoncostaeaceae bacterium]
MIATAHAAAGAAAASRAATPAGAFLAGLASHYLLDRVPHCDYGLSSRRGRLVLGLDLAGTALVVRRLGAWRGRRAAGVAGGLLPDVLMVVGKGRRSRLLRLHARAHRANHVRLRWPLLAEAGVQAALVALVLARSQRCPSVASMPRTSPSSSTSTATSA